MKVITKEVAYKIHSSYLLFGSATEFEFYEIQDFLNRKGYDIVVHEALELRNHIRVIDCTGTVESFGEFLTPTKRVLAIKPNIVLPDKFDDAAIKEYSIQKVFDREVKKNILA